MSFYNVKNPRNFLVRDPLTKLTSDVQELTAEMSQIRNNKPGKTLFFNYPSPNQYLNYEFSTTYSPLQPFLSSNCYASYSNQETSGISTRTDILAPGEMRYITFVTNPTKDSFSNFQNPGLWQTHLFCSSNSSDIYVSVAHVVMYDYDGQIVYTTFQSNNETRIIEQSTGPIEYVFNTQTEGLDIPHPQIIQYASVIMLFNTNTLYSTSITTYYGTDNYAVEGSRVETTLDAVPVPHKTFTWKCGVWQDSPNNPLPGQCYIIDDSIESPVLSPLPFAYMYDSPYYLRISTDTFGGANIYNWFYASTINYIQVTNARDPSEFMIGKLGGVGLDYGTYNPSTTYRNFNYIAKRTYYSDPSINRLFIFSLTGANNSADVRNFYVVSPPDTDNDQFEVYFIEANPDVQAYVALYGETDAPLSLTELDSFFRSFVDNVLSDGNQIANIETIQYQFNNNFAELTSVIPPLYTNFELLDFNSLTGSTLGAGVNLEVNLACGRTYFPRENSISNAGSGYLVGDTVTILGQFMGGEDGIHDAVLTITEVDGSGGVVAFTVEGTAKYLQDQSYINDGGDDQYDTGNYLSSSVGSMTYGTGAIRYDTFATDSEAFVDYNDSIFVCVAINTYNNNTFIVSGELGADGSGYTDLLNYNGSFYFYLQGYNTLSCNGSMQPSEVYYMDFLETYGGVGREPTPLRHHKKEEVREARLSLQSESKERRQQKRHARRQTALERKGNDSIWSKTTCITHWIDQFKQEVQIMKNRRSMV